MTFERNEGQTDASVRYFARASGHRIFLTDREAVFVFDGVGSRNDQRNSVVRMRFEGSNPAPSISGSDPADLITNYFYGSEPSQQLTGVRSDSRVTYSAIYPGIDLAYYGNQGQLEFDFLLAPKSDPRPIRLTFSGAEKITLADDGSLALQLPTGEVALRKPFAYQDFDGERRPVEVRYAVSQDGSVGFKLGRYDRSHRLVIDPILAYSSFLWGGARAVALDPVGNIYVAGITSAPDLPASNGYRSKLVGALDAFVLKLNPAGTQVIYATYLGGRRASTFGEAIAVDGQGNVYVTGTTDASSFPTTRGSYQTTFASGSSFVTKLNVAGNALAYSTFVNGSRLSSIAVDGGGNAYVTGAYSPLTPFATTSNAYQTAQSGCVVAKLNPSGTGAIFATYFGGGPPDTCSALALDSSNNVYLTGTAGSSFLPTQNPIQATRKGTRDAFVAKLDSSGSALLFSTYLGGSDVDIGTSLAVDAAGDVVAVGRSFSNDFPVTFGAFQPAKGHSDPVVSNAFVTKISVSGSNLIYSSYLGGRWCLTAGVFSCFAFTSGDEGIDAATTVALDRAGYAYVGGYANSVEFPRVDAIHGNRGPLGENERAPFIAKVNPGGDRLIYSVLLGAREVGLKLNSLAIDASGVVHGVGIGAQLGTFPITPGMPLNTSGSSSSFLVKLAPGRYPTTVASSSNPAVVGQAITLSADVQSALPTGLVTFKNGAEVLGTAPVANGAAVLSVNLPAGAHAITAVHSADGKVSPPLYQVVTSQ